MRSRILPVLAVMLACALGTSAAAQDEREIAARRARPPEPAHEDPPIEPTPVAADAEVERMEAFHRSLDVVSAESRRAARLGELRRRAPVDLEWGLR